MAVQNPQATPRVNKIGAITLPEGYKELPKRPGPVTVKVESPDGTVENHTLENARDLVNHLGWRFASVSKQSVPEATAEAPKDVEKKLSAADENDPERAAQQARIDALANATIELEAMREKAKSLGVNVLPGMGKARLKTEIEAAEARLSSHTDAKSE